jgi:hypothetical protein
MAELQWTAYDALESYLTTELNTLADNANKLGDPINFAGSDRKIYMDIEVYLPIIDLSGQTNPAINLWMLARTDGTNYEDGGDSLNPARAPDAIIPIIESNAAHRGFARHILTTPDYGKILFENQTGAALATTGNTVKYYLYSEQFV